MRLSLPIITIFLFINIVQSRKNLKVGSTWNYLIAAREIDILNRPEEVLTIDINNSHLIPELHKQGKNVVCYFSGGTIENHRDDKDQYLAHKEMIIQGETKWHELWLDYRMKDTLYPLIKNRMKKAVQNNCDAIEVDCLGAYNHEDLLQRMKEQGKAPLTKEDAYNFAIDLSSMAHELGLSIGLKNVAGLAKRLVNYFDFAVVESCSNSSNVCSQYEDFPKQGKAVFTIHYGNNGSFQNQVKTMIKEQKNFGYTCTFNNDNNLDYPGFSFNCDNGSTLNISSSVPSNDNNISTSSSNKNISSSSSNSSSNHNNNNNNNNTNINSNKSKTNSKPTSTAKPKQSNITKAVPSSSSSNSELNSSTKTLDSATQNAVSPNIGIQNVPSQNAAATPDIYTLDATDASYIDLDSYTGNKPNGSIVASGNTESLDNFKNNNSTKPKSNTGKTIAFIAVGGGVAVAATFLFIKKRNRKYDNAILL